MKQVDNITSDTTFAIPALYSNCLKEVLLVDAVDSIELYSAGSYQNEAFAWLSNEIPANDGCMNPEFLLERYALAAVSYAEEGSDGKSWINSNDHCLWSRVTCVDGNVVTYFYGTFFFFVCLQLHNFPIIINELS